MYWHCLLASPCRTLLMSIRCFEHFEVPEPYNHSHSHNTLCTLDSCRIMIWTQIRANNKDITAKCRNENSENIFFSSFFCCSLFFFCWCHCLPEHFFFSSSLTSKLIKWRLFPCTHKTCVFYVCFRIYLNYLSISHYFFALYISRHNEMKCEIWVTPA